MTPYAAHRAREAARARARTRRCLVASLVAHALLVVWLVRFPPQSREVETLTEVTWVEPREIEPPKAPPAPAPSPEPAPPAPPRPRAPAPATRIPAPAPRTESPSLAKRVAKPSVREAPGASGLAARGAAPGSGEKGRAAGTQVAREVQKTTAQIDQLLAGLGGGTRPPDAAPGGTARGAASRYEVKGGRGSGDLPSAEGVLGGTGAGEGGAGPGAGRNGTGRGVQKPGIAIVDDGLSSAGDGASAAGRDSRSLMATVQRYVAGVRFCYDNALKKTPQLQGKIALQMDIAASGEVTDVRILDDTMGNAALERCIAQQVQSWRFPAIPAGTVRFTLPLVFTPPQPTAR